MKVTLKAARINTGLSQYEVSRRIGKSRTTLNGYESGRIKPTFAMVKKLTEIYGCDLNDIIVGDDNND